MHRHGRLWRISTERRRLVSEAVADFALLVPVLILFVFSPGGEWAPPAQVVLLVGATAVASMVRFEVGSGSTAPTQLTVIPLWFAVPPEWLTPIVGFALVLGGLMEHAVSRSTEPVWRRLLYAGDAWAALGPAIVFTVAGGTPEATVDAWPIVVVAFMAQVATDGFSAVVSPWMNHGLHPRTQVKLLAWIYLTDAALAPIGFVTAVVSETSPLAVVALLPLIGVIAEFARERRERLEQALQLSTTYRGTAQLMGDVLEADDAYTGGEHTQGVVEMAIAVGLELKLPPADMRDLEFGALLHDIGKLRVPNEVINKPGSLNEAEWELIRLHPIHGQEMLERVGGAMLEAGRIVRAHHERWDGAGYPDRLRGTEIPLAARIITVCDSFSAMTTNRSYSRARTRDDALIEMQRCSGSQFDPVVVDALYRVLDRNPELSRGRSRERLENTPAAAAALGLRPIT